MAESDRERRQRAWVLHEARRAAQRLETLLQRAGAVDQVEFERVKVQIIELAEQAEPALGGAAVKPRQIFFDAKGLREERPRIDLSVDESGDSLRIGELVWRGVDIEPSESTHWFALGAVAMTAEARRCYRDEANDLKREIFGHTAVVFHEPHIRQAKDEFDFNGNEKKQERFRAAVDDLIRRTEFTAFGVGIRKRHFQEQYVDTGQDPWLPRDIYALALHLLLERYLGYLNSDDTMPVGTITLDAQWRKADAEHQLAIAETLVHGTRFISGRPFQQDVLPGVSFLYKTEQSSHPLELSDRVARDVYEWIREDCQATKRLGGRGDVISEKFYRRGDLKQGKFGLKVFPDSDIRDRIEAHRDRFRA